MSPSNRKSVHFVDYYEKGNDRKRLTIVLLLISVLVCPVFALLYKMVHAPESIFIIIFSGTVVFPLIILLERYLKILKGKLPVLYFIYFIAATLYAGKELQSRHFDAYYFAFFIGMFTTLNFGLQRFWFSLVYFLTTLIYLTGLYLVTENPEIRMQAGIVLMSGIGVFYCVMYYSRNKMINNIQDYNNYLKLIVNNPGSGFTLFRIEEDQVILADHNHEALQIFEVGNEPELQAKLEKIWGLKERRRINQLLSNEYYQVRIDEPDKEQMIDIKVIPLKLKNGNYHLATIMDVTQQVKRQNELSREVLRAELAEESNKRLAIEIEDRIRAENKLQQEFLRTKAILESSSNTLLLTLDPELHLSTFNSHCKQYFEFQTGVYFQEGLQFEVYFQPIFPDIYLRYFRILVQKVRRGKSFQLEISFENRKGQITWLDTFINPIFDTEGQVYEISLVCHDITQKKSDEKEIIQSLKEKEVLLKEVHHRVKNNLQVISSILSLQSSHTQDEKILSILNESKDRVRSMAIIHENLYRTNNFSYINFSTYVKELSHNLIASYQFNKSVKIDLEFDISEVELNLDQAIPCGLMINEIITNSIKYAFINGEKGTIFLSMKEHDGRVEIVVADNGAGFPADLDYLNSDSLGIQLIVTLIEQLDGNIKLDNSQGIKYLINFEKEKN